LTPAARLSAAAEVLDQIAGTRAPADQVLKAWGRAHRFAGGGDRRAIAEQVYACLRGRAHAAWRMGDDSGRALVLGLLAQQDTLHEIERLFTGEGHAPAPLTDAERERLRAHPHEVPAHVRAGVPEWLAPQFARAFGDDWIAEAHALIADRAPVDLRVNTLKTTRAAAAADLDAAGLQYEHTHLSTLGLRLHPETDVASLPAFKDGRIEVQDESSQLAAWLSGAAPGMTVVDYCAGGGGKTLALGALLYDPLSNAAHPGERRDPDHAESPPNSAHPGECRDPDHKALPSSDFPSSSRERVTAPHSAAEPYDLGPGIRRDERGGEQNNSRFPGVSRDPDSAAHVDRSSSPAEEGGYSGDHQRTTLGPGLRRGSGWLIACDVNPDRLAAIKPRLARAGVAADLRHIGPDGEGTEDLRETADLVFVDAPCSGSGAWRRQPEQPWRLTPDDLERFHALQTRILARAATLVRPGGRLLYATCSVLPREDEDVATAFAAAHPHFRPVPIAEALETAPNLTAAARRQLAALARPLSPPLKGEGDQAKLGGGDTSPASDDSAPELLSEGDRSPSSSPPLKGEGDHPKLGGGDTSPASAIELNAPPTSVMAPHHHPSGGPPPPSGEEKLLSASALAHNTLRLSPRLSGTDGFFIALFERIP
jgi:16S rRNA C967 or C1407 C5-methylase (RsmB/RsmF family)